MWLQLVIMSRFITHLHVFTHLNLTVQLFFEMQIKVRVGPALE